MGSQNTWEVRGPCMAAACRGSPLQQPVLASCVGRQAGVLSLRPRLMGDGHTVLTDLLPRPTHRTQRTSVQRSHSTLKPHSSAVLSCMQGSTLTTAWVGDSRMVLGRQKKKGWRSGWEAIDLSTDHKPTTPEERARILDSHGRVERCACLVSTHPHGVPLLQQAAVSTVGRPLGQLGPPPAHQPAVCCRER